MKKILSAMALTFAFTFLLVGTYKVIYAQEQNVDITVTQDTTEEVKDTNVEDTKDILTEEPKQEEGSQADDEVIKEEEVPDTNTSEDIVEKVSTPKLKINLMSVVPTNKVVVNPINLQGWTSTSNDGALYKFIKDVTSPLGIGAINLSTANNNDSRIRIAKDVNVKLSDIEQISFSTKLLNGPAGSANASFRLYIDNNGDGVGDQWVVYETYYNFDSTNITNLNDWQTWDVKNGKFWGAWNPAGDTTGGNKTLTNIPGVTLDSRIVGISLGMGNYNPAWSSLVDKVIFGDTEYDFEPAQVNVCSTTNTVHTTNLTSWRLTETRATGHNELTNLGLHIWTEGSNSTDKAAGYKSVNIPLKNIGEVSMVYINNGGGLPGLQLGIDKENDGIGDGYLVGEPNVAGYGSNWWASKNDDRFGLPSGMGYADWGTLEDYLNAWPNAVVTEVGYSLGSGVKGNGVIKKLTAGCNDYTFGLAIPTVIYPENSSSINTNDFWFDWTDVSGASSYEFQASQNSNTDSNGSLTDNVWHGDYQGNEPVASTAHSMGANGTWFWQVRTVDSQGNKGPWSPVWKMTIDMYAPEIPANLSWTTATSKMIINGGITNEVSGTASWTSSSTDVDHYIYKYWNDIVGNVYKVGSEYTTTVNSTSLPGSFTEGEGVHYFCVEAIDAAGNKSDCSQSFKITYDNTAPTITVKDGYVGDKDTKVFSNVSFKLYDKNKVDKYTINGFEVNLSDNQWSDANFNNFKNHLVQGQNTFVLYDVAGNSTTYVFTYSTNQIPTATITIPSEDSYVSTKTNGNKLKVTGTFTDDKAVNYLQLELVYGGNLVTAYTMHYSDTGLNSDGTFSINIPVSSNLVDGEYSLFYTPTDFENGIGPRLERKFIIDNTKPEITASDEDDVNPASITLTATDTGSGINKITGNIYKYDSDTSTTSTLFKSNSTSTVNPFTVNLIGLPDGHYYVKYNASDKAGNISSTKQFEFIVVSGNNGGDDNEGGDDNSTTTPPTTPASTGGNGGGALLFTTGSFSTPVVTPSTGGQVLGATAFQFTKDLKLGSVHDEVKALQKFLNLKGFTVATSGAGSLGNETRVFGPKTKAALIKYQEANPVILTNVEILDGKGTGNFFFSTRGFVNELLLNDSEISASLEN